MNSFKTGFTSPTTSIGPKYTFGDSGAGGAAGGLIGGIISAIGNIIIGGLNYSLKKKQNAWERNAWKVQMAREDNAMQRRVLDLQMAGLSPTLAAGGSGAGASSAPTQQAPTLDMNLSQDAQLIISMLQGQKNIAKTEAEVQLLKQQKNLTRANAEKQAWDNTINKTYGYPSDPSVFGKPLRDLQTGADTWWNQVKKYFKIK